MKKNPLFKGLPDRLKDPKVYLGIEKKFQAILKSDHKHKTIGSYYKCKECEEGRENRKKEMKKLGFKSFEQYLEWKKIIGMVLGVRKLQNEKGKKTKGSKHRINIEIPQKKED